MATMLPIALNRRVPISFSVESSVQRDVSLATSDEPQITDEQLEFKPKVLAMNSLARPLGSTQHPTPNAASRRVPRPDSSESDGRTLERRIRDSMKLAGRSLMMNQFVHELDRVLDEQASTLPLLPTAPEWALKNLHRQYLAIRTAAELLEQPHLAAIAERGEVLICMLSRQHVRYKPCHLEAFGEALDFLRKIARQIASGDADQNCFTTVCVALSLFAAVEPSSRAYTPEKTHLQRAISAASAHGK